MNLRALWVFLSELEVSQGEGAGDPFTLLPWQKRALRGAFGPAVRTAAITVSRVLPQLSVGGQPLTGLRARV